MHAYRGTHAGKHVCIRVQPWQLHAHAARGWRLAPCLRLALAGAGALPPDILTGADMSIGDSKDVPQGASQWRRVPCKHRSCSEAGAVYGCSSGGGECSARRITSVRRGGVNSA